MENETLSEDMSNVTYYQEDDGPIYNFTYIYICVPIITFCCVMAAVNFVILTSMNWVSGSLTPTLHISLSLAGSDVVTLILDGLSLFFNSLLPIGLGINQQLLGNCSLLVLEGLRMGGRLTTVGHLIFLALIHYLGIRRPLQLVQHPSYCKYSNKCIFVSILWILPSAAIITYFSLLPNDGLQHPNCTYTFLVRANFRYGFSIVFFTSMILMAAIYGHIYYIVRKHQENRNQFRRAGSIYNRNRQVEEESNNEKALITTLLIVGSTVIGWLPASLVFALVCRVDCIFKDFGSDTLTIAAGATCNILLILKTALNSYIYAARMQEIKKAMRKMKDSLKRKCCKFGSDELNGASELYSINDPSRRTFICRIRSLPRHGEHSAQL